MDKIAQIHNDSNMLDAYLMSVAMIKQLNLLMGKIYIFIIYYVMKCKKILIKYNAYISQPLKYKNLYFHSSENTRYDIFTGEKP